MEFHLLPGSRPSEPVQTGVHTSGPVRDPDAMIDELRERIDDLKGEVEFYRDELRDQRQTTAAKHQYHVPDFRYRGA